MLWTTQIAVAINSCRNKGYVFDVKLVVNRHIVQEGLTGHAARIAYNCIMGQI
jgi:hypothetical protein